MSFYVGLIVLNSVFSTTGFIKGEKGGFGQKKGGLEIASRSIKVLKSIQAAALSS